MIIAIQIRGKIRAVGDVKDTLQHLNLGKKHSCVVVEDNPVNRGMLEKAHSLITYGEGNKETIDTLKKLMTHKTAHLHPPRGGYKSTKKSFTNKGDLGNRGEAINDLVKRMLP